MALKSLSMNGIAAFGGRSAAAHVVTSGIVCQHPTDSVLIIRTACPRTLRIQPTPLSEPCCGRGRTQWVHTAAATSPAQGGPVFSSASWYYWKINICSKALRVPVMPSHSKL